MPYLSPEDAIQAILATDEHGRPCSRVTLFRRMLALLAISCAIKLERRILDVLIDYVADTQRRDHAHAGRVRVVRLGHDGSFTCSGRGAYHGHP